VNKNLQAVYQKLASFCAYQERSEAEVKIRLKKFELSPVEEKEIVQELQKEKFLDEQRFAKTFVSSKFRQKSWGKLKIAAGLREKGVRNDEVILKAFAEIDEEEYQTALEKTLKEKLRQVAGKSDYHKTKVQLMRFAVSRGFEFDLTASTIRRLLKQEEE
jgi:regulatory protein